MKITYILGCLLILMRTPDAIAQRLTTNDPNFTELSQLGESIGWHQIGDTKAWIVGDNDVDPKTGARCMVTLDKLRAAGVPDTRAIEVQYESPEFKAGTHTLAEIRTSCEHVAKEGRIQSFEKWALLAMQAGSNVRAASPYFRLCIQTYNDIIKAGVSPSDRVPDRMIGGAQWSGSIEDLRKKYCEAGQTMAAEATASQEAPFRKELSGDKLKIALKYGSVFLPGGAGTGDAHKMAAASVWFIDLSPSKICLDGRQVHTLRRYQFGGPALVSTTEKDYCGNAPRAAFQ